MAERKEQAAAAPAAEEKKARAAPPAEPLEYEAVVGIDFPDGPENLKRALAGQTVTKWVHLEPGETSRDIPAIDVPWLLREKFIKAVK